MSGDRTPLGPSHDGQQVGQAVTLIVAVLADRTGYVIGAVPVQVERTDDDLHTATHAILEAQRRITEDGFRPERPE